MRVGKRPKTRLFLAPPLPMLVGATPFGMPIELVMTFNQTLKKKWNIFKAWAFAPPYAGVPWLVWLYAFFCFWCYPHGGVFAGHLSGFDDHARMTQVLNWVNGAGWYDRTIMRANMPEGFSSIWVRLVDIPLAFVVLIAQAFTDQRTAALIATTVVPFAQLALLFPVARYFARPIAGKDKAWLIILFLMFTTVLNFKHFSIGGFQTGEASHHSWYLILNLGLFGAAGRIAMGVPGRMSALIMGASTALLLAIGIEGFVMIAGCCAMLVAIGWYFERPNVARRGMQAMLVGAIANFVLLPLHRPPSQLFEISFTDPSIMAPILVGCAAAYFGFQFLLQSKSRNKNINLIILLIVAGLLFAGLVSAFPQIKDGAAAGLSPAERKMALSTHYEALPLYKIAVDTLDFIGLAMPTLIALVAGLFAICGAKNSRRRAMYLAYFGFAALCGGMTEKFSRFVHYALATACAWLLWLFERVKERLPRNHNYNLAALACFIMIGPFWMLLLPAMDSDAPFLSQVVLYPAKIQTIVDQCDLMPMAFYINDHYSEDKTLIVPDWDSSRFLYHTKVRISFLANYPSHDKFIDNANFFATRDPDEARILARKHEIDLVTICRLPLMLQPRYPLNKQMLIALLQAARPPSWLKLVDTRTPGNYLLYEVDKTALVK